MNHSRTSNIVLLFSICTFLFVSFVYAENLDGKEEQKSPLITVEFIEINESGYPIVEITNTSDEDIDDITGSFIVLDELGNTMFMTGQQDSTKGLLFLEANSKMRLSPYGLKEEAGVMEILATTPERLQFYFEAKEIIYMEGAVEENLEVCD